MKVLVYGNRKMDDVLYDASTPEKRALACLRIFELLDEEWQVYSDLDDVDPNLDDGRPSQDRRWRDLRDKARQGDAAAAETLITQRSQAHYEYEEIRFSEVETPRDPTANQRTTTDRRRIERPKRGVNVRHDDPSPETSKRVRRNLQMLTPEEKFLLAVSKSRK